jgi:hypothetical protein
MRKVCQVWEVQMFSRFSSSAFHLPLFFIGFFLCWPLRATDQRDLGQPIAKSIAARNPTEFQQGADPQSDDPKSPANDSDPLFPVVENRKWGYMDKTGKIVIAPKYYNANPFTEGIARVEPFAVIAANAIRVQFIDKSGKVLPNSQIYSYAAPFSEGMAVVVVAGERNYSYIDTTGKRVIEQDRVAGSFQEGLAAVGNGHRSGYIDKTGQTVIPLQFDSNQSFREGLAPVKVGKKWGFVDKTGKLIISAQYELAIPYYESLAAVKLGGKWGYIDKDGMMVIPPQFTEAFGFCDGLASIKIDGKWGYIDKGGRMVIPAQYEMANKHSEGLAGVKFAAKWGFVDTSGHMIVAPQFDEVGSFTEGLSEVRVGGKWGYIDKTGEYIWTPTN